VKRLLLIVLVAVGLVAAAFIAPLLLEDPGHVVIDIGQWRIEMSLLALAGAVLLVWIVFSLVSLLLRLPARTIRRARELRSRRQLENGFLALTEGDWQQAEHSLQKSLRYRGSTAGYLAAARAAQGRGDRDSRDRMLALADTRFGRRHFVTGLARARLLIGEGRIEEAVPVLEESHLRKPRHTGVLRLLLESYQELGRWRDIRLLTPALRRAGVVDRERAEGLAALAGSRELESAADVEHLEQCWKELGRKHQQQRDVVLAYARRSSELGRTTVAGRALAGYLKKQLDDELLRAYADVGEDGRAERIGHLERWLEEQPGHGGLLLSLGLLYLDDRQYDKARSCLEEAVRKQPGSEGYAALGRVLDHAGKLEAAAQCYRNALRLRSGRGAEPLPPPSTA